MDITVRKRNIKSVTTGSLVEFYPHDLQIYNVPPLGNIDLQEFEELAIERLKLLRILASVTTLKGLRIYSEEWKESVLSETKKEDLTYYVKLCKRSGNGTSESELQARRKDHISHFILRLAYCRSEELRRWFISRELELFKMRFQSLTTDGVDSFFKLNNLKYEPINKEEKSEVLNNLYESTTGLSHVQVEKFSFYKVRFHEVFDLIKNRKVYLHNGFAYIPYTEFVSVLSTQYRSHLRQSLAIAARRLPQIEQDERIIPLLKGLHNSYTGTEYSDKAKALIPIESLDTLSAKSFPLCMRQLHEHLRSSHHLKHGGRIQYGLFLKAIGVTLEDSLRFWREEFTKIMDLDKFEKQYAYNVRYNYGKEGSRKNYSPFSCMKIIQSSVGPGDVHGCPFRHSDAATLKNKLHGYGLATEGVNTIVDFVKKGHYQIACSKYFDIMHNVQLEIGVNHPNQYFEESQNLSSAGSQAKGSEIKQERNYVYSKRADSQVKEELMTDEWDGELEVDFDKNS